VTLYKFFRHSPGDVFGGNSSFGFLDILYVFGYISANILYISETIRKNNVRNRQDRSENCQLAACRWTEYENVTNAACSIGECDVSIQVVAKDTDEVYRFITETVRRVPGVRRTTTSIFPVILKDVYQRRAPESVIKNPR
jgi:hypothetical protein